MKGKLPSPADKTQLRIAKDKREFNRLLKEAQKHLVEGHSPSIYDYLDWELSYPEGRLYASSKAIDDGIMSSVTDMGNYMTSAEKRTLETVDLWSAEYQQVLKDAEERNYGWISDLETRELQYVFKGEDYIRDGFDNLAKDARDTEKRDEDLIIITLDEDEEEAKDDLEKGEQEGPGFWGSLWDATVGLPEAVVNIGKLLDAFVNLDPEKFIEDNIELIKSQKKLQERVIKEGL